MQRSLSDPVPEEPDVQQPPNLVLPCNAQQSGKQGKNEARRICEAAGQTKTGFRYLKK